MDKNQDLFEHKRISSAVFELAIPAVISQIITVVYNMADTYFIGQINDPNQVAAASIILPVYMVITGFANLFGIGGASLVARSLGRGDKDRVKHITSFSVWAGILSALIYSLVLYLFNRPLLLFAGANDATLDFCYKYIFWTVIVGSVPTLLTSLLSHLVRAEGYSRAASFGIAMGGVLNIVLDPIFILVLKYDIEGAAIATFLSNLTSALYYLIYIAIKRSKLMLSLDPRNISLKGKIPAEVITVGLPSLVIIFLSVFANVMINKFMSLYSNEAIAGVGIAKKVDSLMYAVSNGIAQGVLPLIAYNYSSGNIPRMKEAIKKTLLISFGITTLGTAIIYFGSTYIVRSFIDDPVTVMYGSRFQKTMCMAGPCTAITMVTITVFQAVGYKIRSLILTICRKGGLDVPFMAIFNSLFGVFGIVYATPAADICAMCASIIMLLSFWKKLSKKMTD